MRLGKDSDRSISKRKDVFGKESSSFGKECLTREKYYERILFIFFENQREHITWKGKRCQEKRF